MNKRFALAAIALALAACSPASPQAGGGALLPNMRAASVLHALGETGAGKISHVVYIVQENRSFDNVFQGYPGADTVSSGKTRTVRREASAGEPGQAILDRSLGPRNVRSVRGGDSSRNGLPHGCVR